MSVSLADLLVLFGFENNQFFLLDPFSIEVGPPNWGFLLIGVVDVNSLVLVIFLKSGGFGLNRLLLNNWLSGNLAFSNWCIGFRTGFFRTVLNIFFFLELILQVSDISPASSFFSGPIAELNHIYALPVPLCLSW